MANIKILAVLSVVLVLLYIWLASTIRAVDNAAVVDAQTSLALAASARDTSVAADHAASVLIATAAANDAAAAAATAASAAARAQQAQAASAAAAAQKKADAVALANRAAQAQQDLATAYALAQAQLASAAASAAYQRTHGRAATNTTAGKSITVSGDGATASYDGDKLVAWHTDDNVGQKFTWNQDTNEITSWDGRCVDVPYARYSNNQFLQLWGCNGLAQQKWVRSGSSWRPQDAQNMCLEVQDSGNPGDNWTGKQIQLYSCGNSPGQMWS